MALNTLKTTLGFLREAISRYTPFKRRSSSIQDIYNYLPIDNLFPTSGQPDEDQLKLIGQAGYTSVINLAPTSVLENSIIDEQRILNDLGINYIHQPVDFKNPTEKDFNRFIETLQQLGDQKVWVHCAANMRVSAFTYRYRTEILKHDKATAKKDLEKIWQPFGAWKHFIKA